LIPGDLIVLHSYNEVLSIIFGYRAIRNGVVVRANASEKAICPIFGIYATLSQYLSEYFLCLYESLALSFSQFELVVVRNMLHCCSSNSIVMLANTEFTEECLILGNDIANFLITQLVVDYHLSMKFTCGVVLTGSNFDLSLEIGS
jgi:hypothetical protein